MSERPRVGRYVPPARPPEARSPFYDERDAYDDGPEPFAVPPRAVVACAVAVALVLAGLSYGLACLAS